MSVVEASERQRPQKPRAAKTGKRHSNQTSVHTRNLLQVGLDVAIAHVVSGCHKNRNHIQRDQRAVAHQRGQLSQAKGLAGGHGREDDGLVNKHSHGHGPHHAKRHAPTHGQANRSAQRQAKNLRDRRARGHHRKRQRRMPRVDQPRRHHRRDRPKDRVRRGHYQARDHQNGIGGRNRREKLPRRKDRYHAQQQPLELKARRRHHKRQRQQHDAPRVDRDHHACGRLADREGPRDVGQKANGHELRGVEHKRRARKPQKRQPLPQRNALVFQNFAPIFAGFRLGFVFKRGRL